MWWSEAISLFLANLDSKECSPGTLRTYQKNLTQFISYLEAQWNGPVELSEVSASTIDQYLQDLKHVRQHRAATRANVYHTLRSFYRFAVKRGWLDRNPMEDVDPVRVPERERTYLLPEEVNALIDTIDSPLVQFTVLFLYHTGLRISECVHLTLDQVDLEQRVVHVIAGKGGKDRTVPLSHRLADRVAHYLRYERPLVPTNRFLVTAKTGALSANYVNDVLRKAAKELGWERHVSAHTLRHSFASELVRQGVNIVQVQKLLGHRNVAVTSIYAHAHPDDLAQAVEKL